MPQLVICFNSPCSKSAKYYCPILMELEFSRQTFESSSNIKFHEKSVQWEPSCWKPANGRTDGRPDMKKLIVAFRDFASAHKNSTKLLLLCPCKPPALCGRYFCKECLFLLGCLSDKRECILQLRYFRLRQNVASCIIQHRSAVMYAVHNTTNAITHSFAIITVSQEGITLTL